MGPQGPSEGSQARVVVSRRFGSPREPWCIHHRNSGHGDGAGLLDDWGTHDPELCMRGFLERDHHDTHGDCRCDGHLSCMCHLGGSPLSSRPELVDHQITCQGMGSARRDPSVGWVITPTHRVLRLA